tara:strand:- start:1364 stop:1534 length:171 start_codon:yes stop_codon:yes gene_type:complete
MSSEVLIRAGYSGYIVAKYTSISFEDASKLRADMGFPLNKKVLEYQTVYDYACLDN